MTDRAQIGGKAEIFGNATVFGKSMVFEEALIYGNALVYDNAEISDHAEVYDGAWVYGDAFVGGNAEVYGRARFSVQPRSTTTLKFAAPPRSAERRLFTAGYGTGRKVRLWKGSGERRAFLGSAPTYTSPNLSFWRNFKPLGSNPEFPLRP